MRYAFPAVLMALLMGAPVAAQDTAHVYFDYQVEHQAQKIPGTQPPPYPSVRRAVGAADTVTVLAQFVVDETGRVRMDTFKDLRHADPAFVKAVHDALPGMRFKPAMIQGRAVPQLVQQPFAFVRPSAVKASGQASACTVPPSDHSLPGVIRATLRPTEKHALPGGYAAAVLDAIGQAYASAGAPMTLGAYAVTPDSAAVGAAFTALLFTATDAGGIKDVQQLAASLSPSFDSNAVVALRAAGAAGLPRLPPNTRRGVQFELEVATAVEPDTARDVGDTAGAVRMRWLSTPLPVWARAVPGRTPPAKPPEWPYSDTTRFIKVDSMLIQYVIDRDGRIAPGTPMIRWATYRPFVRMMSKNLPYYRYLPTTIDGCPVATLVTQSQRIKMDTQKN